MKPQNTVKTLTLAAAATVVFGGFTLTEADARPNNKRPAKVAKADGGGFKLGRGLAPEIKAQREKFRVWREDVRGGRKFFADSDHKERKAYAGANAKITKLMVDDRLSDEDGFALLKRVEGVGEAALEESGREPLTEEQSAKVMDALEEINAYIADKKQPLPKSSVRTPNLNRFQIEARNITRFGLESGVLSEGKSATINRKIDTLQRHEAKAKESGELSDRNREKLFEEAIKLGRLIIKEFRS